MRSTKLILVEGIPGTGKSTTAQFIDRGFRSHCANVSWYHEDSSVQPVRLFFDPTRHVPWSVYLNEAEDQWRKFVLSFSTSDSVAVFDASILQNHVRSLLLFGCKADVIADLVLRIESIIRPLSPSWIYLKPDSIEDNFRRIGRARGEQLLELWVQSQSRFPYADQAKLTGSAGFIEFWNEVELVAQGIFDRLTISKTQINVTGSNWNELLDSVERFFNFDLNHQLATKLNFDELAGIYSSSIDNSQTEVVVELNNDSIAVICANPTFDPVSGPFVCFHKAQLIPVDLDHFSVLGWPHTVTLIRDDNLQISGLNVRANAIGWPLANQIFRRKERKI